jgi:hypothetical protein
MKRGLIVLLLTVLLASFSLHGENISDRIRLNGFLSQGFVYTTDNDFIPNSGKNGSFELAEFGITLSVDVTDKLHLGLQLLARDFGNIGNHNLKLDWGFADYRFADFFGIRVGKVKTPVALYNEIRNTDALYSMAVLPQSIYDEFYRSVFVAYEGLGIYGNLNLGGLGDFDYHMFYGSVSHTEDAPYIWQIQNVLNWGVAGSGAYASDTRLDTESFYGGRMIWNTPLKGLRLAGSYAYLKANMDTMLNIPLSQPSHLYGRMELTGGFFLSLEYVLGDLTISSEYMELPVDIFINTQGQDMLMSDEVMQGYYVMVSYLFGDKFTLTFLYDHFYADKDDKDGLGAIAVGNPAYFHWQKDMAVGLRFDVNFNWTIKLEWHRIDGLSKSYIFSDPMGLTQKWNMIVAKCSFNF